MQTSRGQHSNRRLSLFSFSLQLALVASVALLLKVQELVQLLQHIGGI